MKESTEEGEYIQSTMMREEGVKQGWDMKKASAAPCRRRNGQLQTVE